MNNPTDLDLSLLIPYAFDTMKERIIPDLANKGQDYECPECHQVLLICIGEVCRPYFRHKEYLKGCAFREDGADRVLARHALLNAVLDRVEGKNKEDVMLIRHCSRCGGEHKQPLPNEITNVLLKHPVKSTTGESHIRYADVALLDDKGQERCLVEIYRGREKPEYKFAEFTDKAWIILRAKPTLLNPHQLDIKAEGNLNKWECQNCKDLDKAIRQRRQDIILEKTPSVQLEDKKSEDILWEKAKAIVEERWRKNGLNPKLPGWVGLVKLEIKREYERLRL